MTQENTQHRYSITDILGAPCSEEEARRRIREETDLTTLDVFHSMQTAAQERLLEFIMGKRGLAITYDTVFRHVLVPNGNPERLEHLLSCLLKQKVTIEAILNREGCQISETASFPFKHFTAANFVTWSIRASRNSETTATIVLYPFFIILTFLCYRSVIFSRYFTASSIS